MGIGHSTPPDKPVQATPDTVPSYEGDHKRQFWTEDGKGDRPILYAKIGPASEKDGPTATIPQLFNRAQEKHGKQPALLAERPVPALVEGKAPGPVPLAQWGGRWTWTQYYIDSQRGAKALLSMGFEQHDAVNVYGFNSPEWLMTCMITMMAGGKIAGIYPSDTIEQVIYKCRHSGAVVFCVESIAKMKSVGKFIDELPKLKAVVVWGGEQPSAPLTRKNGTEVRCLTWDEFLRLGDAVDAKVLQERDALIKPSQCCALIYTSGTTGNPKAVMITHDNLIYEGIALSTALPFLASDQIERLLSYLPLSHIAGMTADLIAPIWLTATQPYWAEVYFARPYDLKVGSIADRLRCVKPTQFLGVPYVWQKIAEKMKEVGAKLDGPQKWAAQWARKKGLERARNAQVGGTGAIPTGYSQAEHIFGRVRKNLGLESCRFGLTGAAPISVETLEYFGALGIQINEVYGMSESTGCTTLSTDKCHQWGSCGWAMVGAEVKCFVVDPTNINNRKECPRAADIFSPKEEEQGELCFRGRHIMLGYMANPDLGEEHVAEIRKKNLEAIDADGWLHSGDKGCISQLGMIRITGRYKELIIGSGGENIAPVPIEDHVKKLAEGIANIMMVGDKRKFNVALVTLKARGATGELPGTDELVGAALKVNPETKTVSAAMKDPVWHKYITDHIVATNKLNSPPSHIQRFTILPQDFSVKTLELTPTLKLKRAHVEKQWKKTIDGLYAEDAPKTQAYFPCDLSECPTVVMEDGKSEAPVAVQETFVVSNPEEVAVPGADLDDLRRKCTVMDGGPAAVAEAMAEGAGKPAEQTPAPAEKSAEGKE